MRGELSRADQPMDGSSTRRRLFAAALAIVIAAIVVTIVADASRAHAFVTPTHRMKWDFRGRWHLIRWKHGSGEYEPGNDVFVTITETSFAWANGTTPPYATSSFTVDRRGARDVDMTFVDREGTASIARTAFGAHIIYRTSGGSEYDIERTGAIEP